MAVLEVLGWLMRRWLGYFDWCGLAGALLRASGHQEWPRGRWPVFCLVVPSF